MIAAWMVYAVVVSIPIVFGAMALGALFRRHRIAERGVWIAGVVLALGIPLLRFLPVGASAAPTGPVGIVDLGLPAAMVVRESGLLDSLEAWAVILWIGLTVFTAVLLARSVYRLLVQRREWTPAVQAGEDVLVSEDVGPAVFGFIRPEIVLPRWISDVPEGQLDLIVRHEVQHIRAGDPWVVAATLMLRVLLPWHPGIWALTAGLRQALELDCDRRVLDGRLDVRSYGETVLAVASRMRPGPAQPVAAFTESVRFIKRRLLAMTQPQKRLGHYGALSLASLVALVIVGACETPVPSFQPDDAAEPEEEVVEVEQATELEQATEVEQVTEVEQATEESVVPFTVGPSVQNRDQIVEALEAEYPPLLRDAGIGGTVRVMMFIDKDGQVTNTRIDESSGHEALDNAALRVARAFDFSSALNHDEPVGAWIAFPITFAVR
jgi:TonB family protein